MIDLVKQFPIKKQHIKHQSDAEWEVVMMRSLPCVHLCDSGMCDKFDGFKCPWKTVDEADEYCKQFRLKTLEIGKW